MKLTPLYAALLLMGCSPAVKHNPRTTVVLTPGRCIVITGFTEACRAKLKGLGYRCNGVELDIKPIPTCDEFNRQQVVNVRKPQ